MQAIFFDLETTDKHPVGQIINYSFILVDENFEPVDELNGLIRVSRLQLPDPGAMLANRTCILEHQERASDTETIACQKICDFVSRVCKKAGAAVPLVGFNSARFDIPYLRTTCIRNGINPYFSGKAPSKDLLHAAQKIYCLSQDFQSKVLRLDDQKLTLRLERLAHSFDLLSGTQAHESREDVLLTIRVAKILAEQFGVDIRSYEPYEGKPAHDASKRGYWYLVEKPEYDLSKGVRVRQVPMTLLEERKSSSLWINLEKFRDGKGRESIEWCSIGRHAHFVFPEPMQDAEWSELARRALAELADVNLDNFFTEKTCDIEGHIYRIGFNELDALGLAIRSGDGRGIKNLSYDAQTVYRRHCLANAPSIFGDAVSTKEFSDYVDYRYGGKMELGGGPEPCYHATLPELFEALDGSKTRALDEGKVEDTKILTELETFYHASDVIKVAKTPCHSGSERVALIE